ncbi:MAG: N-acylneuraminate-9-phosphate synthase [bacterium]|nr:N-acylneuraminate-9-phosphate synthase [bacterium]
MSNVLIGNKEVGSGSECFVVSEIGAMYESIDGMKQLIKESKEAGADAVKIQTYRAETIALPGAEFEFEDGSHMSQFEFFKQYEISRDDHKILFDYAAELGIMIFSTPSFYDDADFLDESGVPAFKTGADDLTNYPFLKYIAKKGKPMIVSTGVATMAEVDAAVQVILSTGNEQLVLLHSTTSYPPEPKYANLNIIHTLQRAFNLPVGYSDHVFGTFSSVLAASMGACIVEKHFTLDRSKKKGDYQVSLEPRELKKMVEEIRMIDVLKGSSVKKVYEPEEKWRKNARKSLVAARDLTAGEVLKAEDIKIMRPGTGIHPQYLGFLIGRTLKKDIQANELIPGDGF